MLFVSLLALNLSLGAELIHTSRLKTRSSEFHISRSLFSPLVGPAAREEAQQQKVSQEIKKTIVEEISASYKYTGHSIREGKMMAIISGPSQEVFFVEEGETIPPNIKIIKISKEAVTLEYENQQFEIKLDKGSNNEQATSDK